MHPSYYKRPLLLLLLFYIVGLFYFYTPHPGPRDIYHHITSEPVVVSGQVIGFPAVKKKSQNVVIQVSSVNGKKAGGRVYARFETAVPSWHESVLLTGKLQKPYSIDLLGNFDWGHYLATQHVFTEMKVSSIKKLKEPSWFFRAVTAVRSDILHTFEAHFDRDLAAIAGGVLLGEKGEIDEQLYTDFQDSGAIHLLVASGGNVGFVTLVVFAFCSLFGLGRRKTVLCALIVAGLYTLIAGADAPLTRAYFMTLCAVIGYFLHRNSGVFQGLILSCLVILLCNPAAIFETGFQMSFLATLAIIVCLNIYELPYRWPRWIKFFVQIFLATLSTQLVLLPVFTNVFYKVSFVGLISNMILVPLASLLMAVSFAFYLLCCLHVGFILHALTGWLLTGFEWLVQFFASWPMASVPAAAWKTGWIISYYAVLFLLFHLPQKTFIRRVYKPLLLVAVLAPIVQGLFFNPPTIWLLNEWNNNAILFRASNGTRILIGAGIKADKLARAVRKSGGRKIDAWLLCENNDKQKQNIEQLQTLLPVGQVVIPFENTWPEEIFQVENVSVQTLWGRLLNRRQEIWINKGYSGQKDNVSYQITTGKKTFLTAGNERFIVYKDKVTENERNGTKTVKL